MRLVRGITMAVAIAAMSVGSVMAAPPESTGAFLNVASNSTGASGSNASCANPADTRTYTATGGFDLGSISWAGNLRDNGAGSYQSEARVTISAPGGSPSAVVQIGGSGSGWSGVVAKSGSSNAFAGVNDPAGLWTFAFCETYNDGGAAVVDAYWDDITFSLNEAAPPVPPANTDLGTLPGDDSDVTGGGTLGSGGIQWYKLTIPYRVGNHKYNETWLNIRTTGMDTELGIYRSNGTFVATDDDDNGGYYSANLPDTGNSMLSFGAEDIHAPGGDDYAEPGEDGLTLAAGTYYVAVGGYNTTFGADWDSISAGTTTGTYGLTVNYMPEPGTLCLLALGAFGLIRRRR